MAVTADDLVKEVKDYNWDLLTDGNPSVADRSLDKARIWLKAKMIAADGTYNEEDEIQRLILIKRALYELYSYAEQEAVLETTDFNQKMTTDFNQYKCHRIQPISKMQ